MSRFAVAVAILLSFAAPGCAKEGEHGDRGGPSSPTPLPLLGSSIPGALALTAALLSRRRR